LGILVHSFAPELASRVSGLTARVGNLTLLAAAIPLVFFAWRPIATLIGNGTLLAMIAFAAIALVTGYALGGPDPAERSTLALATASRHPGLAIALAAATFPGERKLEVAAILLYVLISILVAFPYVAWRKRRLARSAEQSPSQRAA
jgi:BASS family bile acid:Na+ symporter